MGSDIQSLSERVDKTAPFMKTISDEIDSLKKEFENIREKVKDFDYDISLNQ